jgi:hypothetical protein
MTPIALKELRGRLFYNEKSFRKRFCVKEITVIIPIKKERPIQNKFLKVALERLSITKIFYSVLLFSTITLIRASFFAQSF